MRATNRFRKLSFWVPGVVFLGVVALVLVYARWSGGSLPQERPAALPFPAPDTDFPFNTELKAALVYDRPDSGALAAYRQVLAEEGFPFEQVPAESLLQYGGRQLKERYLAVILPEEAGRRVGPAVARLLQDYVLGAGGKLFLALDAGTVDERGFRREAGLFSALAGCRYDPAGSAPGEGGSASGGALLVPGQSPLRKYFDPTLFFHDSLQVFDCPPVKDTGFPLAEVSARVLACYDREAPENGAVLQKNYPGGGAVLAVNGAPGLLKCRENVDFVLRSLLKYFLMELAGSPRLVASPNGTAGLVVAVHICSGAYFRDLDRILAQRLFSGEIPFSFYLSAGPDNDRPGDKRGVDVLNPKKGGRYLGALAQYGSVGSHGGWIHNYWAYNFKELSAEEKKDYIDRNYLALKEATGQPVLSYAAPGGAHDSLVNDYLASWGTRAVSLPICFNSPPTHGWFDGRPEQRFWIFGYTGTVWGTAFENMLARGRRPKEIVADICQLIDSLVEKREIRLIYFHPVSIARNPEMWKSIQGYILKNVQEGNLSVRTVNDYAGFLDRREKVLFSVRRIKSGYSISARSPETMKEMTFALPLPRGGRVRHVPGYRIRSKDGWVYATITKDANRADFLVPVTGKEREGGPGT